MIYYFHLTNTPIKIGVRRCSFLLETYDLRNFGKKLKRLRVALGYSQLIVSRETGVNIDTLRKIETATRYHAMTRWYTLVHCLKWILAEFWRPIKDLACFSIF